jgi:hypothetical protein
MRETGPWACSEGPRTGVTAASDWGDESIESRLAPFVLAGVESESAGKKRTLIFFS